MAEHDLRDTYDKVIVGNGWTQLALYSIFVNMGQSVLCIGGDHSVKRENERSEAESRLISQKLHLSADNLHRIFENTKASVKFKQVENACLRHEESLHLLPTTRGDALSSPTISKMQRLYVQNFFQFLDEYAHDKNAKRKGLDLDKSTTRDTYRNFGLDSKTAELLSRGIALQANDENVDIPGSARTFIDACLSFIRSASGPSRGPFVFPEGGIGSIRENLVKKNTPYACFSTSTTLKDLLFDGLGKVAGVKVFDMTSQSEKTIRVKQVITDPLSLSHDLSRVAKAGTVTGVVLNLKHLPSAWSKYGTKSVLVPASSLNRRTDVYGTILNSEFGVCPDKIHQVVLSTVAEEDHAAGQRTEMQRIVELLGFDRQLEDGEKRTDITFDIFEPLGNTNTDNVFVCKGNDASNHAKSIEYDIEVIYQKCEGKQLVL